jgi:hypothetical protein
LYERTEVRFQEILEKSGVTRTKQETPTHPPPEQLRHLQLLPLGFNTLVLGAFAEVEAVLYAKNKRICKTREAKISLCYHRKLTTFVSPKEHRDVA